VILFSVFTLFFTVYAADFDYKYNHPFECKAIKASYFVNINSADIKSSYCPEFSKVKEKANQLNESWNCDILIVEKSFNVKDQEIPKSETKIWKYGTRRNYVKTNNCPVFRTETPCPSKLKPEPFTKNYKFCIPSEKIKVTDVTTEDDMSAIPQNVRPPKNPARK